MNGYLQENVVVEPSGARLFSVPQQRLILVP